MKTAYFIKVYYLISKNNKSTQQQKQPLKLIQKRVAVFTYLFIVFHVFNSFS